MTRFKMLNLKLYLDILLKGKELIMIEKQKKLFCIDATGLHIIAMALMLLDHLWATIIPGNQWMTYMGRLAFPIFAFLISEGFVHTSNFKNYALRLLFFGLISEVPFDLMYASTVFYPFHQNVMFTLLLGLLAIRSLEQAKRDHTAKAAALGLTELLAACAVAAIGMTDYGVQGVLTVVAFYLFRSCPFAWIGQLISLVLLNILFFQGMYIPVQLFGHTIEFQTQGFAVLALLPIWLYNGKKGRSCRLFQYGSYTFYPAHMLVLYLIFSQLT